MKRQKSYNPQTGTFDERYSPLIDEDDMYMPRRSDGSGPDVEILQGSKTLDDIKDIEYFKKKMVAPTKIPFARVGIGEGAGQAGEKSLSSTSSDFAKAVQWVQREGSNGLTKVCIVHLALRGYSIQDIKGFEISLTSSSAIEDLYRMETWQTRVQVMSDLKALGWFPKEWIVTHFTDLTPDEIQELKEMERIAIDSGDAIEVGDGDDGSGLGPMGGGGGGDLGDLGDLGGDTAGGDEFGDLNLGGGAASSASGAEEAEEPEGAEEPEVAVGETFNVGAEKRLLTEIRWRDNQRKLNEMLTRWARRRGKDLSEIVEPSNNYGYLLEHKEFDGLSLDSTVSNSSKPRDPNSDSGLLVEWSVSSTDRDAAISETIDIITASAISDESEEDATTVTSADLPG